MAFHDTALRLFGPLAAAICLAGCEEPIGGDGDGDGDGDVLFEIGTCGEPIPFVDDCPIEEDWVSLSDGDTLEMTRGGQGLLMFAVPLRAYGFELPENPKDFQSEKIPYLDITVDVEGHEYAPGGHFIRLANYPVTFSVFEDEYIFDFLALILPDEIVDPAVLDGEIATINTRFRPYDAQPVELTVDVVLSTIE